MAASPLVLEASRRPIRLGVVGFLNTLPLIDGLERLAELELHRTVPSLLLERLLRDEVDLALCSSIDYQRSPEPLVVVPAGLLGCAGPTLTVRLYSAEPIERVEEVYCDSDSHTSVAMMQILLKELHGIGPAVVEYDAREHMAGSRPLRWPPAMLLIGDKVVTDSPPAVRYPHQLDLGEAWRRHTGRPFVFALWMARRGADPKLVRAAAAILERQRLHNRLDRREAIVHRRAAERAWPLDLAADYLGERLAFEFTDELRAGLELFFDKACSHGLVGRRRPLEILG